MFNKLSNKLYIGAMAIFGALGLTSLTNAAADADLAAGFASTTAIYTDNKSLIISYAVGLIAVLIVVGLVIKGLFFSKRLLLGVFGGGRRRR